MRFALTRHDTPYRELLLALLAAISVIAGCATPTIPDTPVPSTHAWSSNSTPVTRYGRYTLVELVPDPSQQDLMQQVIDLTVPATANATVGDTLRYLLLRSGYQLCDDRDETRVLDALPLPAAHIHLGPLILSDALQVLVGRAWQLEADEGTRKVCFSPRTDWVAGVSSSTQVPAVSKGSHKAANSMTSPATLEQQP